MQSILIHPENAEQLRIVKAVLKALKVQFESQTKAEELPDHVLKGIDKSLAQFKAGNSISLEEFTANNLNHTNKKGVIMPTIKRATANHNGRNSTGVVDKRSHANDAYVLKKVEQAKEFINKAGVPKSRTTQ